LVHGDDWNNHYTVFDTKDNSNEKDNDNSNDNSNNNYSDENIRVEDNNSDDRRNKIVEDNHSSVEDRMEDYNSNSEDDFGLEDADNIILEDSDDNKMEEGNSKLREIKGDKIIVPVRFLNDTITFLHSKFNDKHPDLKMSRTSFWKNIPKYFSTKGKKRTDMCHICDYGKKAIKIRLKSKDEELNQQVEIFFIHSLT
jgi:hypothetical protein